MAIPFGISMEADAEIRDDDTQVVTPLAHSQAPSLTLCVLCHGMHGSKEDWRTWIDCLSARRPDWTLLPLESLTRQATPLLGIGVDGLATLVAQEIVDATRRLLLHSLERSLTLHCIGHSMGGVILRGALPEVLRKCPAIIAGVFCSLSTPHLGIRADWGSPGTMWRNLSFLTAVLSPQCPQLAVQDRGLTDNGPPYLVALAEKEGPYVRALGQFRRRLCVTMARNDVLIPATSGALWAERNWKQRPEPPQRSPGALASGQSGQVSGSDCDGDSQDDQPRSSSSSISSTDAVTSNAACWVAGWGYEAFSSHRPRVDQKAAVGPAVDGDTSPSTRCSSESLDGCRLPASPCTNRCSVAWVQSADKACKFPREAYDGLLSLSWDRLVLRLKLPQSTPHVFLIAKKKDQWELENSYATECVKHLVDLVLSAADEQDVHVDAPRWLRSVEARPAVGAVCVGRWVVATEEGVNNVKFYPFLCEDEAICYFDSLTAISRVLFDPCGDERRRAGANVASWSTIRKSFAAAMARTTVA